MKTLLILLALVTVPHLSAQAPVWKVEPALDHFFAEQKTEGVFVLFDPASNTLTTQNQERAQQRFYPASTFKIPNSIIGLSTGAVKDIDEVLPYGGKPQFLKQWEQDMNLRDAIRVSNVPVYQELARRIGLERMRENVRRFEYGNEDIGTVIDRFWLDGPLKISAVEQTRFLHRYLAGKIPGTETTLPALQEITLLEEKDGKTLHAKTGWSLADQPAIGWWVGWVMREDGFKIFALNITMLKETDAPKRLVIGRQCLSKLGVW